MSNAGPDNGIEAEPQENAGLASFASPAESPSGPAGAAGKRPRARKSSIASDGLLVLLVTLFLYTGLALYSGTWTPIRLVKGHSMEPTLKAGDLVLIKSVSVRDIRTGDIVAFKTPDRLKSSGTPGSVLHRVKSFVSVDGQTGIQTAGDNSGPDQFQVGQGSIEGRLMVRVPWIGKPAVLLSSRTGLIYMAMFALILVVLGPLLAGFYFVVVKANKAQTAGAPVAAPTSTPASVLRPEIENSIYALAREQAKMASAIGLLSASVAEYGTHLMSHTSVVKDLAVVASELKTSTSAFAAAVAVREPPGPTGLAPGIILTGSNADVPNGDVLALVAGGREAGPAETTYRHREPDIRPVTAASASRMEASRPQPAVVNSRVGDGAAVRTPGRPANRKRVLRARRNRSTRTYARTRSAFVYRTRRRRMRQRDM